VIDDLWLPDMSPANVMRVHVVLGAIGILSGVAMLRRMVDGRRLGGWNALFLVATIATSVTGLQLHPAGIARAAAMIVLAVLAAALVALVFSLAGLWRVV
jgi:hypothetical protein